jgi:hypothetical protein
MYDADYEADDRGETIEPAVLVDPEARGVLAVVDETAMGRRQCTLFPADVDEERLTTTWLSASEGSFVSLAEMR